MLTTLYLAAVMLGAPAPGDTCTLSKPAKVSEKDKGKGKKTRLAKGAEVEVVAIDGPWVQVKSGEAGGFTKLKPFTKICKGPPPPLPVKGGVCFTNGPVKVAAKENGKGKKAAIKKGEQVQVISITGQMLQVLSGSKAGYIDNATLQERCPFPTVKEPEPEPDPAVATAPEETAEGDDAAETGAPGEDEGATTAEAGAAPEAGGTAGASEGDSDSLTGAVAGTEGDSSSDAIGASAEDTALQQSLGVEPQPEEKQPGDKIKVAVMDLKKSDTLDATTVGSVTALIPQTLDDLGPFKAISSQEIQQMLQLEAMKQSVGCDDVSCLAEIGGALGADYLISGSILLAGDTYLLQLQMMNIGEARVDSRVSREYKGGPKGLFDEMRTATKLLVRDILAERSGTLSVAVNEEGATIRLDGTIIGTSPMEPRSTAGGMHTLAIEKEGFVLFTQDVEIQANQTSSVDAVLRPSDEFLAAYRDSAGLTRTLAWTFTGVGVAAIGGGVAMFFVADGKAKTLKTQVRDYNNAPTQDQATFDDITATDKEVATFDLLTLILGGVGLAAVVTGSIMFATGDDPDKYDTTTATTAAPSVSAVVGPGGVGIIGRF